MSWWGYACCCLMGYQYHCGKRGAGGGAFGVCYDHLVVVQVRVAGIVGVREAAVVSWQIVGMRVCAVEPRDAAAAAPMWNSMTLLSC